MILRDCPVEAERPAPAADCGRSTLTVANFRRMDLAVAHTYVSAKVSPPPPQRDRQASRTRVRNQRRTTSAVIGFCDRRAHGTAARLRPHLHHRPQPHL